LDHTEKCWFNQSTKKVCGAADQLVDTMVSSTYQPKTNFFPPFAKKNQWGRLRAHSMWLVTETVDYTHS